MERCQFWRQLLDTSRDAVLLIIVKSLRFILGSFELILGYTVLFDDIVDDRLSLAVNPAGQVHYEEMEALYDMCHCTNRLSVILSDTNIIQFIRIFAPYGYDP